MNESFHDAIRAAGLIPPDVIEPGRFYRFNGDGKRNGNTAGWCKLFADGEGGVYGDWSTGLSEYWQAQRDKPMSTVERDAWRKRIEEAKREADAEQGRIHVEAAKLAKAIYDAAGKDVAEHPYATRKRIDLGPLVRRGAWSQRGWDDALIVPLYSADGKLASLEAINADGDKDFLKGGAKKGAFHPLGKIREAKLICIGEGLATVAVVDGPAVAAMDAGNLLAAAEIVRQINPTAEIVFLADNDVRDDGRNPGIEATTAAAHAVGGTITIPDLDGRKCDFWDVWNERGADAVSRAIANARTPEPLPAQENAPVGDSAPLPKLIKASDVVSRPINWLWPGWIAGGKLHIIGGAPGLAKTTIALAFAATISAGGRWPDGTRCAEQGDAVIWSGEDGIADTLKPRLEAMGANLEHVHFVGGIPDASGDRPFDPASDMRGLLHVLADLPTVRLVIVDPVVSAVAGDSHKNAEVRRGLQPLVDFGEKLGIAVIGITHFSKGTAGRDPLERLTGSIAFGALARLVFGAAKLKDEDGEEYRAFVRIKSNIGEDGGGFRYDVDYSDVGNGVIGSHILWGESIEGAAREILRDDSNAGDPDEQSAAGEARQFLESLLSDGPMRAGDVQKEGRGAGFSESAIRRAGDKLKVLRHKDGMRGGWVWTLPTKASTSPEGAEDVSLKRLTPTTPSATSSVIEVEI